MGDTGITDPGPAPGWYSDPRARFELRYHNGVAWTADVSTGGERFVDPLGTGPAPLVHARAGRGSGAAPGVPLAPGEKNSIATTSMVLGIVAICVGWIPFVVVLAIVGAVLAIVLGVQGRKRAAASPGSSGAASALAGIITGAVALLVCVGGVVFSVSLVRTLDRFENPADHDASITSCVLDGTELTASGTITNTSAETATFTVRVFFVRRGTDNPQRQATVPVADVGSGETGGFEVSRQVGDLDLDCIIGAVRGPLPYGADPGT